MNFSHVTYTYSVEATGIAQQSGGADRFSDATATAAAAAAAAATPALSNVSFAVPPSSLVLLVGANGAGKSTLLELAAGRRLSQQRGAVTYADGRDAFTDTSKTQGAVLITSAWAEHSGSESARADELLAAARRKAGATAAGAERFAALVAALGVAPTWGRLAGLSAGQRRRVQLALALAAPAPVVLLDEVAPELDAPSRAALLRWLRADAARHGSTVVLATHVFDGMEGWATHALQLHKGRLVRCGPMRLKPESPPLHDVVLEWLLEQDPARRALFDDAAAADNAQDGDDDAQSADDAAARARAGAGVEAVAVEWSRPGGGAAVLRDVTLTLPAGGRAVVSGANGAGKTTFLNIVSGGRMATARGPGGKLAVGPDAVDPTYDYAGSNAASRLISTVWRERVADLTAGANVPFAALAALALDAAAARFGGPRAALEGRLRRWTRTLEVDDAWTLRKCSQGQKSRIQLALNLLEPAPVLLLDEVAADLDVVSRAALLGGLRRDSEARKACVVYATHALSGLDAWATHAVHFGAAGVPAVTPVPVAGGLQAAVGAWLAADASALALAAQDAGGTDGAPAVAGNTTTLYVDGTPRDLVPRGGAAAAAADAALPSGWGDRRAMKSVAQDAALYTERRAAEAADRGAPAVAPGEASADAAAAAAAAGEEVLPGVLEQPPLPPLPPVAAVTREAPAGWGNRHEVPGQATTAAPAGAPEDPKARVETAKRGIVGALDALTAAADGVRAAVAAEDGQAVASARARLEMLSGMLPAALGQYETMLGAR